MLDWLLAPLGYEFMHHAIAIGCLVGILCPVVGSYLIVQRMAMLGDVINCPLCLARPLSGRLFWV